MINFLAAKRFILKKLRNELSPKLYYHSVDHTIDVYNATLRLAKTEKINRNDLLLLKTAALFHDAGLIKKYREHEDASIEIAKNTLTEFGYTQADIDIICSLISSTRLPQNPENKIAKILCDADLDHLGRDDFFMIAHKLRYEWGELGYLHSTLKEWYQLQIIFLEEHRYFTHSANDLRYNGKIKNLSEIKDFFEIQK
ncbi:MAG: HD domain-containing protein [Bacteroidetes bacterium]|nr:HD domain-containing protein [Bacteroidota bacterium]